jgi:hypothetical protein
MIEKAFLLRVGLTDWKPVAGLEVSLQGEIQQFTEALFQFYGKGAGVAVSCVEVVQCDCQPPAVTGAGANN